MARIEYDSVTKVYDDGTKAVEDLDLPIEDGELMVLVGPSGCGKTTALRMLAGLEEISGGEIRIGDRVVNDLTPKDRDVAMVFQSYALYPHMTVHDNLAFGLKLRKTPKQEVDERVRRAAKVLQIEEFLKRKPRALSGGQRQRVAMGRASGRTAVWSPPSAVSAWPSTTSSCATGRAWASTRAAPSSSGSGPRTSRMRASCPTLRRSAA